MPIYEYQCADCQIVTEHLVSVRVVAATSHMKCLQCGGELGRIISSSSFVLKGTGWYQTDYKGK